MTQSLLTAIDLSCHRNEQNLFSQLNFGLNPGEGLWVMGANGSGKTSLLRILAGLLAPSSGGVYWQQKLIQTHNEYLSELVYLGHKTGVKLGLTVLENLRSYAAFGRIHSNGDWRKILAQVGLENFANTLGQKLSAGQRQRLALSRLLLSVGKIWILDEPFTALDQSGIQEVGSWLKQHMAAGGIVIIASHHEMTLNQLSMQYIVMPAKAGIQVINH